MTAKHIREMSRFNFEVIKGLFRFCTRKNLRADGQEKQGLIAHEIVKSGEKTVFTG